MEESTSLDNTRIGSGHWNLDCDNMPEYKDHTRQLQVKPMPSNHRINSSLLVYILPVAALLFSGCTTVTTQSFKASKNSEVESSHIAVGADFGKYDRLYASDMGIYFPTDAAPSAEDQKRTRQIFRAAFLAELTDYQIVQDKGPTTLDVQATIVDYRNAKVADASSVRRELRDIVQPGALMFLMELKDSESGEVLARAADSTSAPAFATVPDAVTDWTAVEAAAARWAKLFRGFLDNNLNQ